MHAAAVAHSSYFCMHAGLQLDPAGLHLHALAAAIETKKDGQSVITEPERDGKGVLRACMDDSHRWGLGEETS